MGNKSYGVPSPSATNSLYQHALEQDLNYYPQQPVRRLSRQNSYTSQPNPEVERPQTLELPLTPRTPVRSSLKKTSYSGPASGSHYSNWSSSHSHHPPHHHHHQHHHGSTSGGGSSGAGTPTNPTPPDSLGDDPFAKSDSGFISTNRVRFSPSPFDKGGTGGAYVTDWSPTHDPAAGVPPHPLHRSQRMLATSAAPNPGAAAMTSDLHRSAHYITENDLKRDFDFYPSWNLWYSCLPHRNTIYLHNTYPRVYCNTYAIIGLFVVVVNLYTFAR